METDKQIENGLSYLKFLLVPVPSEWAMLHLSKPSQLGPSFAITFLSRKRKP